MLNKFIGHYQNGYELGPNISYYLYLINLFFTLL